MSVGDPAVDAVAACALELIDDGACVGLGSGRTASAFVRLLGARVRAGLHVTGVPTSGTVAAIAREVGIPLVELSETELLDITVDGADEVAPNLDLIKGHGGALLRERIVAAASKRQLILVSAEKLVKQLGERFALPVEVFPFAEGPVSRAIRHVGLDPHPRMDAATATSHSSTKTGISHSIARSRPPLADARAARALESLLRAIPGVVDTGLFLGTAERVLVGHADGRVDTLLRDGTR